MYAICGWVTHEKEIPEVQLKLSNCFQITDTTKTNTFFSI